MALFGVTNPLMWYAFLSVIPLILLYLIRPRPKEMAIPSLMFFMQASGSDRRRAFLRNFIRDVLFLIQLLTLLLLSSVLLGPFTWVNADVLSDNVAFVIDISASSQVKELGNTRFDLAISETKNFIGSKNTIVLAKGTPEILVKNENRGATLDALKTVKPTDERSKIGDAILLAGEILGNEGKLFVISDFKNTEGADPIIAANALKSRGIALEFIDLSTGKKSNFGIIDLSVEDQSTSIFVKNYNEKDSAVNLKIGGLNKQLLVPANGVETFAFKTPGGITKIELLEKDDFDVDNLAYISAPEGKKIKVLLITNTDSVFLRAALGSADYVELTVAELPIIPDGDFDVYVVDNVDPNEIITGTFTEIEEKVKAGANLIINAQNDMREISYKNLLPVEIKSNKEKAVLTVNQINQFTRDVEFGKVNNYFEALPKAGTVNLVSAENSPIIALNNLGSGNVFYYGILDGASDFKLSPYYPIFWINVLKFLIHQEDIATLNVKTGSSFILGENEKVKTPSGEVVSGAFVFDQVGVYSISGKNIAANLLSDKESDINLKTSEKEPIKEITIQQNTEKVPKNIEVELLILIGVLLFLEIVYIKTRGEL